VFFAIMIVGWRLAFTLSGRGSDIGKRLGISLLLLLPGALVYIPWIGIQTTYGLPFLLSPAFLFGFALTSVERYSKRGSVLVQALAILLIASLAVSAHRFARQYLTLQQVNAEVAARIALSSGQDSTLVVVARKLKPAWVGPGPALARYVLATTGEAARAPVRDISCAELPAALQAKSTLLLVSYHFRCGSLSHPTASVRRYFRYLDLSTLAPRVDSVRADLLLKPAEARGGAVDNSSSPSMPPKR
jgi:hypothetical protein